MNRLIHARLLFAIAIATTIGAAEFGSRVFPASPAHSRHEQATVMDSLPTLPTITVHAHDAIPTLPVVLVRPTPAQLADANAAVAVTTSASSTASPLVSAALPHVRLDMPYYSFGKMLPNVIKD
ncbi:MAG: hypothetical protein IPP82_16105 [Xanthomonadales bacterium]|nr:hypothetical protein [Xanthomonadales bacterium]